MRTLGTELTLALDPSQSPPQPHSWNLSPPSPSALTQRYSISCSDLERDDSDAATHTDEDLVLVPGDEDSAANTVSQFNDSALTPYTSKPIRTCSAFSVPSGQQLHLISEPQPKISSAGIFESAHPHSLLFAAGIAPPQPPSECIVPTPHHAVPIYPASLLNLSGPGSSLHIGFNPALANPNYNMAALINAAPSILPTPPLPALEAAAVPAAPAALPASSTTTAASTSVTANDVESDEDYNDAEEDVTESHSRPSTGSRRKRSRGGDHTREAHVMTDRQRRAKIKTGMDSLKQILKAQGMVGQDQASITLNSVTLLGSLRQELQGMHNAFSAALQELESVRSLLEPSQPQLAQAISQRVQGLAQQRQQTMYEATQSRFCGGEGGCPKSHNAQAAMSKGHHHPPGHSRAQHSSLNDAAPAAAGAYPYAPATLKMEQ